MAVLSKDERTAVGARFQSDASDQRIQLPGVTKTDIQAMIALMDQALDDSMTGLMNTMPNAYKNLPAREIARALFYTARRRFEVA